MSGTVPAVAPRLHQDLGWLYAGNGFIAFLFAATGPVAIVIAVTQGGNLATAQTASWLFGSFLLNGLLTIAMSVRHRQPLIFFWTIPGTVLLGPALTRLGMSEIVGAFVATGVLMLVLGRLGWVGRLTRTMPMPIVMGMVAGVFVRFGTDLVVALHDTWRLAVPMALVFVIATAVPALGRRLPPLIAAMLVGVALVLAGEGSTPAAATAATGAATLTVDGALLARPLLQWPVFSLPAMVELVVPLAITVLFVQNAQGYAVLHAAGHRQPPVDAITMACGAWSVITGLVGAAPTCLTGPSNALATSSGEQARHYTAAVVTGVLAIVFGLFAPLFTRLMIGLPSAFIATLAGLAMLRVLQAAFVGAFRARFSLGALTALLVTLAGRPLAGIGAPFWGLVFGVLVALALERADFAGERAALAEQGRKA